MRRNILKGNTTIELFNLAQDIQEQNDVAAQHPDLIKKMRTIMEREHIPPKIDRFKMPALGDKKG